MPFPVMRIEALSDNVRINISRGSRPLTLLDSGSNPRALNLSQQSSDHTFALNIASRSYSRHRESVFLMPDAGVGHMTGCD